MEVFGLVGDCGLVYRKQGGFGMSLLRHTGKCVRVLGGSRLFRHLYSLAGGGR